MEQIFLPIDTHREKRVELGVLIEPTTSACYGGVWPEAAPFSTRPRTGGLGWLQSSSFGGSATAVVISGYWSDVPPGIEWPLYCQDRPFSRALTRATIDRGSMQVKVRHHQL